MCLHVADMRGPNSFFDVVRKEFNYHYKLAIIDPPAKHYLNSCLADDCPTMNAVS